jgi:formate hydrogenlyase transcriptional activator
MIAAGTFRSDLFYRLNVFPIHVPPLRERREDIPLLVRYFAQKFSRAMDRHIEIIPGETMQRLQQWNWPGNIRELSNLIERAVIVSSGAVLQVPMTELAPAPALPADSDSDETLEQSEREHILRVLRETKGVIAGPNGAAARLGLKRTTLHFKMKKLGIRREDVTES